MAVEDLIQTVLEELRNIAQTEVHVGKPVEVGSTHVIPVSKISMGFGAGGIHTVLLRDSRGAGASGG